MDADTKAELDRLADLAEAEYQVMRAEAAKTPHVLTDGVCRITEVEDALHPPCVGKIYTDLGEKFPVFDVFTREQAKSLVGKRVKLAIQMSAKGTRYVTGMMAMPVDTSTDVWPCPRCGKSAWHMIIAPAVMPPEFIVLPSFDAYVCESCHYQMEVGP